MARLNEASAPAPAPAPTTSTTIGGESVEALKRRFIRQNREIARVNSNQSIRIRNLETEISRLLAENIAIREDAINARAEAEKWRSSHRLNKEVTRMKEQLESKLAEVSALVGELGCLPDKAAARRSSQHQRRRHGGLVSELLIKTGGDEKESRQRHATMGMEQEGRLPAILEDKHYPRRTLETSQIQALVGAESDQAIESPDLGPPPVAHFDEPESVAFDPSRSPRRTSTELIEESEGATRVPATQIESRRKRRTSALLQPSAIDDIVTSVPEDTETKSVEPPKRDAPVAPRPILKTGAKRKLDISELEDTSRISKELDDFIFQRKANAAPATSVARQSRFSRPPGKQSQENSVSVGNNSPERPSQTSRKILAPKSTNSPAKKQHVSIGEKFDVERDGMVERKPEKRIISRIRTKPASIDTPVTDDVFTEEQNDAADDRLRLDPKTPAPELGDVLSPVSTEPSTKQRPPKEMAITNSVEDVLNGSIGRGSRRARAQVNYAQPNLRDKMRRPGKELVGAVEGLAKVQTSIDQDDLRIARNSIGLDGLRQDRKSDVSAAQRYEDPDVLQRKAYWQAPDRNGQKSEPPSPLRGKAAPSNTTSRPSNREEGISKDALNEAVSRLSVFDPLDSSPVAKDHEDSARSRVDPNSNSNPALSILTTRRQSTLAKPPTEEESTTRPNSSLQKTRRPSSALGIRQRDPSEVNVGEDQQRNGHKRQSVSVSSLPSTTSQLSSSKRTAVVPSSTAKVTFGSSSETRDQQQQQQQQQQQMDEILEARTRSSALTRRKSMMV